VPTAASSATSSMATGAGGGRSHESSQSQSNSTIASVLTCRAPVLEVQATRARVSWSGKMHIHHQPLNPYITNLPSPGTVATRQAAEVRRRLAKGGLRNCRRGRFLRDLYGPANRQEIPPAANGILILAIPLSRLMRTRSKIRLAGKLSASA
jgi:hypothetical protein